MGISTNIQSAIYTRLNDQLSESVYDYVPSNQAVPYVVVGDTTVVEFDTDNTLGFDITTTIHSFSGGPSSRGRKAVKDIMGNVYNALHRAEITVTNYQFIGCDFENENSIVEADGITHHGVQRFRIKVTENE